MPVFEGRGARKRAISTACYWSASRRPQGDPAVRRASTRLEPFPVLQEALDPLVRERMLGGGLQYLQGHRRDISAGFGRVDDVPRVPNTGRQHQRRQFVLAVDLDRLTHDLETFLRNIVEPANERADD